MVDRVALRLRWGATGQERPALKNVGFVLKQSPLFSAEAASG